LAPAQDLGFCNKSNRPFSRTRGILLSQEHIMEIAGYLSSIIIGISLGLIGGGGSILTVPVLVYLFSVDAVVATAYSLFIVGMTSAVGSVSYLQKGLVNIKTAVIFGIPSIIAVFMTRAFIVPAIPGEVMTIGDFVVTKSLLLLILFAVIMIAASYSMIRKDKKKSIETDEKQKFNYPLILLEGSIVGFITGLVGAGGGFLIIPALVVLSKLPMKEAVGTSLVIIAAKSLIGFLGEGGHMVINWPFLGTISIFAIVGIFIGMAMSKKVDGEKLKPAFGWFVLVMGAFIIIKETLMH
jgi:uncharacterized protein